MTREFRYPVLFHPQEELMGPFDFDHPDFMVVKREDKYGGVMLTLIRLVKGQGRVDIATIGSLSYTSALEKLHEVYKEAIRAED